MMKTTTGDPQQRSDLPASRTGEATAEAPLDEDDVFHLLQTERRRLVLHYLRGRDGPVRMRDVAEQVAAWEHDTTVEALTSKQRQRVYIALYQSHLDALDDAGVIEYNKARGVVDPTERVQQLYPYLPPRDRAGDDLVADGAAAEGRADRDTSTYYAGASIFGTGLITASWAGLIALPAVAITGIIIATFTLVAVGVSAGL